MAGNNGLTDQSLGISAPPPVSLEQHIAETHHFEWRRTQSTCTELVGLQLALESLLPDHKVFDVLGQRAISKERLCRGEDCQAEANAGLNLVA